MYRNANPNTNSINMQTSTKSLFYDLNIMKELSDTSTPLASPSSLSSTSSDGNLFQTQQFQFDNISSTNATTTFEASTTLQQMSNNMQMLQQQHQQYLLKQQEEQEEKELELIIKNAYDEDNEISKSLRLFGMVQERKKNAVPLNSELLLNTVRQEFDCNGFTCDDNRYQQYRTAAIQLAKKNDIVELTNEQFNRLQQYELICQSSGISSYNNNMNDVRNKLRMMLPTSRQGGQNGPSTMRTPTTSAASATSATFANMDFNSTKKPYKRFSRGGVEKQPAKHCVFCENNNEPEAVVKSHAVRDSLGRVLCPKLRTYICPICKASGDFAHTVKYCPQKPIITMEDAIKAESYRQSKNYYTQKKSNFIY